MDWPDHLGLGLSGPIWNIVDDCNLGWIQGHIQLFQISSSPGCRRSGLHTHRLLHDEIKCEKVERVEKQANVYRQSLREVLRPIDFRTSAKPIRNMATMTEIVINPNP